MEKQEKLNRIVIIEKLRKFEGLCNDVLISARIDHTCYIIKHLSDEQISNVSCLNSFLNKINNLDELSRLDNIENDLICLLDEFKDIDLENGGYRGKATNNEVSKYLMASKTRKWVSIIFAVLFGCGAAITVVFAFLDNFKILDYGGTVAGAAGIIDFFVGALAFIIERISDSKVTSGMDIANQVHDEESYKRYTTIVNKGIQSRGWFNKNVQEITNNYKSSKDDEDNKDDNDDGEH